MGILWKCYKALFSSFVPFSSIKRYHICSHYFNDFRKKFKNRKAAKCLMWRRDIMVVHLEISTFVFAFMFGWYLGNFDNFIKFWFHISKFDEIKHSIWMTFSLTSNLPFLSRRHARASFWRYQPLFNKKIVCENYLSILCPSLC